MPSPDRNPYLWGFLAVIVVMAVYSLWVWAGWGMG